MIFRGFGNLSYYADRLTKLDLSSHDLRRLQLDLIYCYKIVFGLIKLHSGDCFEFSLVSNTRMHVLHRRSQEFVLGGLTTETPKASRGEGYGERVSPSPAD